jgi:hypothetical protein
MVWMSSTISVQRDSIQKAKAAASFNYPWREERRGLKGRFGWNRGGVVPSDTLEELI